MTEKSGDLAGHTHSAESMSVLTLFQILTKAHPGTLVTPCKQSSNFSNIELAWSDLSVIHTYRVIKF